LASGIARSVLSAVLAIAILTLSKSFVDYSTSGLESPLSHLILVFFLLVYFRTSSSQLNRLSLLAFLTALAVLNRPDLLLLCLPALVYAFWKVREKTQGLFRIFLGLSPLIIWEAFSLVYYGFLTPNTAFAKLNTGISMGLLLQQGYLYFLNSLNLDPISLLVILFAVIITFVNKEWSFLPFVLGIILYMLYVLRIGGDFMSGRYFSVPLLIAVTLLALYRFQDLKAYALTLLVVVLVGLASPRSPVRFAADYNEVYGSIGEVIAETGIADEHLFYHSRLGLLVDNRDENYPGSVFAGRKWQRNDHPLRLEVIGPLGVFSYTKGPNFHVIDLNGLADPLMSRLPVENPDHWRIGHFRHLIPEGYLETLKSGENRIADKNLAIYYDRLSTITRGKLWEMQRLRTILEMNLGRYDHLICSYLKSVRTT
jgi:arabinofuranosyltransferase